MNDLPAVNLKIVETGGNTRGAMASAMSLAKLGSDSNRYLSKYSLLIAPERNVNVPVM